MLLGTYCGENMLSSLPAPKRSGAYKEQVEEDADETQPPSSSLSSRLIPAYPHRGQWVPTEPADFGDGGAYPEIHCVQFPLNMGRRSGSSSSSSSSALVAVEVNRSGQATHDALVKQGLSSTQRSLVQTSLSQAKEVNMATLDRSTMSAPSREEAEATAERTRIALQALMEGKLKKASSMSGVGAITTKKTAEEQEPTYIRYTANPEAPGYNPAAKQRVIKMVDAQVDPMDPSKVQFKKVPKGPPPPPVPVLHSPPRKLTAEDQQAWKIPPCVSNWKNAQGFIIALDKRLAADGRGLQEVTINNKFASLSEALYVSERKAAEDLLVRNQIRKKMAMKEKEDREAQLRELASRARMERGGLPTDPTGGDVGGEDYSWRQQQAHIPVPAPAPVLRQGQQGQGPSGGRGRGATLPAWMTEGGGTGAVGAVGGLGGGINAPAARSESNVPRRDENSDSDSGDGEAQVQGQARGRGQGQGRLDDETEDDRVAREQREALRIERRKERERELRMQNLKVRHCILSFSAFSSPPLPCTHTLIAFTPPRYAHTGCAQKRRGTQRGPRRQREDRPGHAHRARGQTERRRVVRCAAV